MKSIHAKERSALLEIGLMFLPGIPAYLWIWPNISGTIQDIFQTIVYVYILAGTLLIGLRRWSPAELGLNRKGYGITLICGLILLAGRFLIIKGVAWEVHPERLSLAGWLWQIFFYIAMVGLIEELLFRGLIYHLLEQWKSVSWAIWGSSIGFIFWHIFGQGPLGGFAGLVVGLIFALIRWRAGGIVGLILLHGLFDLETAALVAGSNEEIFSTFPPAFSSTTMILLGSALFFGVPVYLWLVHPYAMRIFQRKSGAEARFPAKG